MVIWLTLTLLSHSLYLVSSDLGISVVSPSNLRAKYWSGISGLSGTFGQFPYGSYVYGNVTVVSGLGCSAISPAAGSIFLIKRGSCLFVDKVLNAQEAGAKAVIIYNNQSSELVKMGTRPSSVRIPAVFINFDVGMVLANWDSTVALNLTFSLSPKASPSLNLAFSLSSKDGQLSNLISTAKNLSTSSVPVNIYYDITSCLMCKTRSTYCLGNGRYCAYDADSPKDTLKEVIRQLCILEQAKIQGLLAYLGEWFSSCSMAPACAAGYTQANVTSSAVEVCLSDSYNSNIDQDSNSKLDTALNNFLLLNTSDTPAAYVSEEFFSGELTLSNLQRAICSVQPKLLANCASYYCKSGCWNDMLTNSYCDPACNNMECNYDSQLCVYTSQNTTGTNTAPGTNTTGTDTTGTNSTTSSPPTTNSTTSQNTTYAQCSPGCTAAMIASLRCFSECDTEDCNWSNWMCRCSAVCTIEQTQDSICEPACNTTDCGFDGGACLIEPGDGTEESSSSGVPPAIWIAIGLSVVGFGLLVAVLIVLGCWIKKRRRMRANQPRSPLNIVVPPERLSADQILDILGKRQFVPEMDEFGCRSCVVCLSDFMVGTLVIKTNCKHVFHFDCLREWFLRHVHCPICKQDPLSSIEDTNAHSSVVS